MPQVLYLLPHLDDSGFARQVSLLAPALLADGWTSEVFSATGDVPRTTEIREAGVTVLTQLGRAPKDLRGWLALRWLPPGPDRGIVHGFGLRTFRRLMIATVRGTRPRVVLTLTGRERFTWLDRRFLRSVHRILVPHGTAADAVIAQTIPKSHVEVVPLAVAVPTEVPDRTAVLAEYGLPADTLLGVTVARLDHYERLFEAVWAFEFIRYSEARPRLLVVGDGPAWPRLEQFSRGLAPEWQNIVFTGRRADAARLVAVADVAFCPHQVGGANAALEAAAAGVPVVAANTPDLAAAVRDGVSGVLVAAGSPPLMARELRRFLFDPIRRAQFGAAGRRITSEAHSVERVTEQLRTIYGR